MSKMHIGFVRRVYRRPRGKYIRRQLDMFFSTLPTVAEGFQLKNLAWRPASGRPKLPPAAKSLIERI